MRRTDRTLIGMILVLAVTLIWVISGAAEQTIIGTGDKAPSFTVVSDQGKTISPSAFDGKILVLNFWATYCEGCVQEITSLDEFQVAFASKGVVVLAISMDKDENQYKQFLRQFPVSFTTTRDPEWSISSRYGTSKLPETYIIDRSGTVVEKIIASYNFMDPSFVARIKKLL